MSVNSCDVVPDVNQDADHIPFYENQKTGSKITTACSALGLSIIGIQAARTFLPNVTLKVLPILMGISSPVFYSTANLLALCFFSAAYVFYNKMYYLDPETRRQYNQDLVDKKVGLIQFLNTHSVENVKQFGFQLPKENHPIITVDQLYALATSELIHHKIELSELKDLINNTQIEEETLKDFVQQTALRDYKNGSLKLDDFIRCWEKGYISSDLALKVCSENFLDDKMSVSDFIVLCNKGLITKHKCECLISEKDVSRKALAELSNRELKGKDFVFLWEKGWITADAAHQAAQTIACTESFPAFFTTNHSIGCGGILFDFLDKGMISQKQLQAVLVNFLLKNATSGSTAELILPSLFFGNVSDKLWGEEDKKTNPLFQWTQRQMSLYLLGVNRIFQLSPNTPVPSANCKVLGSNYIGSLSANGLECQGKLVLGRGESLIDLLVIKNGGILEINSGKLTLQTLIVSNASLLFSSSSRIVFWDKRGSLPVHNDVLGMVKALLGSSNMIINREKIESFNELNKKLLLDFKAQFCNSQS